MDHFDAGGVLDVGKGAQFGVNHLPRCAGCLASHRAHRGRLAAQFTPVGDLAGVDGGRRCAGDGAGGDTHPRHEHNRISAPPVFLDFDACAHPQAPRALLHRVAVCVLCLLRLVNVADAAVARCVEQRVALGAALGAALIAISGPKPGA